MRCKYGIFFFLRKKLNIFEIIRDFERFNLISEIKFNDSQNVLIKILDPYPLILILTSSKK